MFNSQSLVSWSYSLYDETGFTLQKSSDSGSTWSVSWSFSSTTTSYTDSDVTYSSTYWYKVQATNSSGTGSFSNSASVFIMAPGALLTASQTGTTQSFISWSFLGNYSMSLYRSIDSGSTWPTTQSIGPDSRSYYDDSVVTGSTYWYKIQESLYPATEPYSNTASLFITGS